MTESSTKESRRAAPNGRTPRGARAGARARWRGRGGGGGRVRLGGFELGDHHDDAGQEPEGLHDADDDEGVGADRVRDQRDVAGEEAEGHPPEERVPGGAERGPRLPEEAPR